ncbi:MAG: hypothetical protein WC729_29455 [Sphingomonas sp.]|jgi:hypothetical protein|uniref:hypothetical protein n=1 Tax=Sphingomonas sp. TaxID=28214 RepID=UPI00356994A7
MDRIKEQFEAFHIENPHVYALLRELALEARKAGVRVYGIGMLWEVLRWKLYVETTGNDDFSLNNNYRALYARMLMRTEPMLRDFFITRKRRVGEEAEAVVNLAPKQMDFLEKLRAVQRQKDLHQAAQATLLDRLKANGVVK